jgi:hypothetical protein
MFAITRNHRSSTLSASVSAVVLAGVASSLVLGKLGTDVPATPQLVPVAMERSASGKIVDRLPGSAPATPRFAEAHTQVQWSMATGAGHDMVLASASRSDSPATGQAELKLSSVAATRPRASARKPARVAAAGLRREPSVVAISPPPRPAALRVSQPVIEIAAVQDKRPSAAARMIAFVGSLASLAHPL